MLQFYNSYSNMITDFDANLVIEAADLMIYWNPPILKDELHELKANFPKQLAAVGEKSNVFPEPDRYGPRHHLSLPACRPCLCSGSRQPHQRRLKHKPRVLLNLFLHFLLSAASPHAHLPARSGCLVKVQACKIRFQTLWKLAVYAATYPAVLCTAYAFITWGFTSLLYALSFAFILLLLEKMILTYPQRREKP